MTGPDIIYDIKWFYWDKESNCFSAKADSLLPYGDYHVTFPNGRRQFFISNRKTGNWRRFRFTKETKDEEGNVSYWFVSEDDIKCKIEI